MEYYEGILLANVAWAQRTDGEQRSGVRWDDLKLPLGELGPAEWSNQFHVWRMDWDESKIELSVDGKVLNTTDLKEAVKPPGVQPAQPFQQPQYMLVNLAIGGTSGGDPAATDFPACLRSRLHPRLSEEECRPLVVRTQSGTIPRGGWP